MATGNMWDPEANWTSEVVSVVRGEIQDSSTLFGLNKDTVLNFAKSLGTFFYLADYSETSYESPEQVPSIYRQAWPYFLLFILVENLIRLSEGKPSIRFNDTMTSISNGLILECGRLVFRGGESLLYLYIYENYRLFDLPWDSAITWYLAALGVDFCFYWVHRASHEVHILWAQHQVHHSSEEFNMAVGLRQSILYGWCGFIFYLPLALFIPPAHFLTHQQFSMLYQFWIHTETVSTLGPLEYIFNTPKHHKVHHGCNIYCLDKNYGGVLIIWDRMFGTFAKEKEDEEIVYGLVYNQPSFNPLHLQTFYTGYVVESFSKYQSWKHKIAAVLYGPSWSPGTSRLGDEKDKVDVKPRPKYNVVIPMWCNLYLLLHFCVIVYGFQELAIRHMGMSPFSVTCFVLYILASLTTFGMMFDRHPAAIMLELIRCVVFVFVSRGYHADSPDKTIILAIQLFYVTSAIWWCLGGFKIMKIRDRKVD